VATGIFKREAKGAVMIELSREEVARIVDLQPEEVRREMLIDLLLTEREMRIRIDKLEGVIR